MVDADDARHDAEIERANELVELIRPLLAGEPVNAQGGALAILVATFLAGHDPVARPLQMQILANSALKLAPIEGALAMTRGARRRRDA